MSDDIQISFVKDALYGAISIVIFNAFGWAQWPLAAMHVVSVPGAFVKIAGSTMFGLAFIASVAVALADVVVVLTLTCNLTACCSEGQAAPAFAPTMRVCSSASAGVQGRLITVTALATVGAGALLSIIRAVQIETAAGGGGWLALAAVYLGIRAYQLTWLFTTFMAGPAVMWAITGGIVAVLAASDARVSFGSGRPEYKASKDNMLYAVATTDCVAVALPMLGGVPAQLRPAFYVVQSACAVVAVWQAHRYYKGAASAEDAEPPADSADLGGEVVKEGGKGDMRARRAAARNLCL